MRFPLEHIDDLSKEEYVQFLQDLSADPDRLHDFRLWQRVTASIRAEQDKILGVTGDLIAYALEVGGRGSALTDDERSRLGAVRTQLDAAVRDHPGFADLVARIGEDADAFERVWTARRQAVGPRPTQPQRRAGVARVGWRFAAAVAVVVFAALLVFIVQRESNRLTIDVESGLVQKITMKDGTHVRLVGPAVLSYVPTDALPRPTTVALTGSAYFDVAGGDTPFVVTTPTARVSVLGTNFGLRASPENTDVVLASGRLSVAGLSDETGIVLESGFASSVPQGGPPSPPQQVDLADALSWSGLFVFRGTSVEVIAERLSEQYGRPVEIDPLLSDQMISGTFDRDRDLQEVLQIIATSLGASLEVSEKGFRLAARPR